MQPSQGQAAAVFSTQTTPLSLSPPFSLKPNFDVEQLIPVAAPKKGWVFNFWHQNFSKTEQSAAASSHCYRGTSHLKPLAGYLCRSCGANRSVLL